VLAELGIAQGWLVMRNQCQRPIEVQSVQFVRNAPADKRPYRRFFNGSVQFNCDVDQLNFSASQLDTPMSHADPHLHEAVRELIRLSKTDAPRPTLVGEVQSVIRMLLPQGDCSIERVCRYLMRDKRTLQRQLRDGFGLTFQDLLQEERLKLVQIYLVESAQSITQIAYATGYREPGNMARAFRRHFGCTPSQWRERHPLQSEAPGNVQDPCSE
jgi:AraC-like DNA-binding protein